MTAAATATQRDALAARVLGAFVSSLDLVSMYLGHKLGFYAALAEVGPLGPAGLAGATGADARYAREWLEQQAVTGILVVVEGSADPMERIYALPEGHAEVLVDPDSLAYMAWAPQMMAAFVRPLDDIVSAYRTGDGVPWSSYGPDMVEGQAGQTRPLFTNLLATEWLARLPELDARLRTAGCRIADVGCGAGWAAIALARAYPLARVDGIDVDEASIRAATANAADAGVADRVRFLTRDARDPELSGAYQLVTVFEAIHDLPRPVEVLAAVRAMLAPQGVALIADERVADAFTAPGDDVERLMYGFSVLHCLLTGRADPPSAATGTVMRTATLRQYAREAGFQDLEVLPIDNDFWRFYRLHR